VAGDRDAGFAGKPNRSLTDASMLDLGGGIRLGWSLDAGVLLRKGGSLSRWRSFIARAESSSGIKEFGRTSLVGTVAMLGGYCRRASPRPTDGTYGSSVWRGGYRLSRGTPRYGRVLSADTGAESLETKEERRSGDSRGPWYLFGENLVLTPSGLYGRCGSELAS